jgi:hypothetical protein
MPQDKISEEQLDASKSIIEGFRSDTQSRWTILTAQMQSGKTTTYYMTASEMLRQEMVENVVIFSGNSEVELRTQVQGQAQDDFYDLYERYLEEELEITGEIKRTLKRKIKNNIHVLWGSQMTQYTQPQANTLYIWDESHYAQTKNMRPHKFLNAIQIAANGDISYLESNNCYMLSVSATPFSEISDNIHENQNKNIVCLEVGETYHSVEKMLNNNLIVGFNDWETCLTNALQEYKINEPKYALIRTNNVKRAEDAERVAINAGWDVRYFDSSSQSNLVSLNELENEPVNHTVVFLKGKCRMGKVVPKQHIAFCMETASNSKTDTILQGLLGRMCGYHLFTNIPVYLPNKIANSGEIERYVLYTRGEQYIPSKAMNIRKIKQQTNRSDLNPIIPIKIARGTFDTLIQQYKNICDVPSDDLKHAVVDAFNFEDNLIVNLNCLEQKREIEEKMRTLTDISTIEVKRVNKDNKTYKNIPKKVMSLFSSRTPGTLGSSFGVTQTAVLYVFEKKYPNINIGDVFLDTRTISFDPTMIPRSILENMPATTKREVFCRDLETGEKIVNNGSYSIPISPDTSVNVNIMLTTLKELVSLSLRNTTSLELPRNITSNQVGKNLWQGILVNKEVYDTLQKGGQIYSELKKEFNVKLTTIKPRGRKSKVENSSSFIRLAEIRW